MADRLGPRRGSLPIPDRQHLGLITHDAKDPGHNGQRTCSAVTRALLRTAAKPIMCRQARPVRGAAALAGRLVRGVRPGCRYKSERLGVGRPANV